MRIRFERSVTNELEVTLDDRAPAALEAQLAPVDAAVSAAEYTLAALLGEIPENLLHELAVPGGVPDVPAPVGPGAPPDLLRRRPGIREAERALAGATAPIGVATANLFPQIAVVGAIGREGQGWGTPPVVNRHIWSFGPAAIWPLVDFGALDPPVSIADLETHARLVRYRKTVGIAVREVDAALDDYHAQLARLGTLSAGVLAGERAVTLAAARYDRGLTDFLNVIDAQRELYELQGEYVTAQVAEAEQFIQLYKSLAGRTAELPERAADPQAATGARRDVPARPGRHRA